MKHKGIITNPFHPVTRGTILRMHRTKLSDPGSQLPSRPLPTYHQLPALLPCARQKKLQMHSVLPLFLSRWATPVIALKQKQYDIPHACLEGDHTFHAPRHQYVQRNI